MALRITSEEYPEYTDLADPENSQWNDEVGWKITYDGTTIQNGQGDETKVNQLHDDFEAAEAAGEGAVVTKVGRVLTNNGDMPREVVTEAKAKNVADDRLSTTIDNELIPFVTKSIFFLGQWLSGVEGDRKIELRRSSLDRRQRRRIDRPRSVRRRARAILARGQVNPDD